MRLEEERENRDPDMVDDNALTVVAKARAHQQVLPARRQASTF